MTKQLLTYHLLVLGFVLTLHGCDETRCVNNTVNYKNIISDSIFVDYNSQNGSNRLHFFNDSTAYTFNQKKNTLNLFTLSDSIFLASKVLTLPQEIVMWFHSFISYDGTSIVLIDNMNSIWRCDLLSGHAVKLSNIKTRLEVLHDYVASQPLTIYKDTLLLYQCYKDYPRTLKDFTSYAKSPPFIKLPFSGGLINDSYSNKTRQLGRHPDKLLSFYEPYPRFTFNSSENSLVICYEPLDTLYIIKMNEEQVAIPIHNKFYKRPKPNSIQELLVPKSKSQILEYYSKNFRYTGIRYNEANNHYLLTFTTPMPTLKEWINTPMKGIVLDKDFKLLKYIDFEQDSKPLKRGDFVKYMDKVAIRTNKIDTDKSNYEKYYILDF